MAYVVEIELMAGAAMKNNLDKKDDFADRVKYHTRRALANAYFDASIRDAVSEDSAKEAIARIISPSSRCMCGIFW